MKNKTLLIITVILFLLALASNIYAPSGADVQDNTSETYTPAAAESLNTSGGTITTMFLNGTSQNERWKAYVGNVSGSLSLKGASNYSIYDWTFASTTGEVYASRLNNISWADINCSNSTHLIDEQTGFGFANDDVDTINNTFNVKGHKEFAVGTRDITQNSCWAIATNINGIAQTVDLNAKFQEVVLYDGQINIYTTLIESNEVGFDTDSYDFQLLVPDNTTTSTETYYFYIELF